jgi:hypothetical protein
VCLAGRPPSFENTVIGAVTARLGSGQAQYYVGHGAAFADRAAGFTVDGSPGFGRLPGVLVPSEHHVADFHAWVRDRLSTAPG